MAMSKPMSLVDKEEMEALVSHGIFEFASLSAIVDARIQFDEFFTDVAGQWSVLFGLFSKFGRVMTFFP
jgi:hypothetical protein